MVPYYEDEDDFDEYDFWDDFEEEDGDDPFEHEDDWKRTAWEEATWD